MDTRRTLPNVELDIPALEALYNKSTHVVAWYAHPAEVRGPFCRWLTVSEVAEQYRKHVGEQSDDTAYAAAAMNSIPHLIAAFHAQCNLNARLAGKLKAAEEEINFLSDKCSKYFNAAIEADDAKQAATLTT